MTSLALFAEDRSEAIRHLRAPRPIVSPVNADVPETKRHVKLRTLLMGILEHTFGDRVCVGFDPFVYFDTSDLGCLRPIAMSCARAVRGVADDRVQPCGPDPHLASTRDLLTNERMDLSTGREY